MDEISAVPCKFACYVFKWITTLSMPQILCQSSLILFKSSLKGVQTVLHTFCTKLNYSHLLMCMMLLPQAGLRTENVAGEGRGQTEAFQNVGRTKV